MDRPAFITGSHAYGTPTADSDIDLVILVEPHQVSRLMELSGIRWGEGSTTGYEHACVSAKFDRLNLLICWTELQYDVWRQGTDELKEDRPVTREQAVEKFKELRVASGLKE
jgi:hypothetical protein